MLRFAITGNIASGKTRVHNLLFRWGYPVFNADEAGHRALANPAVRAAFKDYNVFSDDGQIDRKKLGRLVFSDAKQRAILEDLTHPIVIKEMEDFFKAYGAGHRKIAFAEVPLLFEAKLEDRFDGVILVAADTESRLRRLMARDNLSEEQAKARISAQIPQEEKFKKATFIIQNDDENSNFVEQITDILEKCERGEPHD